MDAERCTTVARARASSRCRCSQAARVKRPKAARSSQKQSEAARSSQKQPEAARSSQKRSEAISPHWRRGAADAISSHLTQSRAIAPPWRSGAAWRSRRGGGRSEALCPAPTQSYRVASRRSSLAPARSDEIKRDQAIPGEIRRYGKSRWREVGQSHDGTP